MAKIAFTMQLRPGCVDEYQRRHDAIWPELAALLHAGGVSDFTIFCDPASGALFAVQQQQGKSSQELGSDPIVQKWWAYMADLMVTNPDLSPISTPLKTVFHLE